MTISPMVSDDTSDSPMLSSSRTIFDTIWSMRYGSTGRLRSAICTERRSLSRSNGTRRPLRLITVSSRSCTRSNVVKRKLQVRHTRRRRITAESSVGREALGWVSRLPQLGQRMVHPKFDSGRIFYGKACPLFRKRLLVDREPANQPRHLLAHGCFRRRVLLGALRRQGIEHLHDHL